MQKLVTFIKITAVCVPISLSSCNTETTSGKNEKSENNSDISAIEDSVVWFEFANKPAGRLATAFINIEGKNYEIFGRATEDGFILEGDIKLNNVKPFVLKGTEYLSRSKSSDLQNDLHAINGVALTINLWPVKNGTIYIAYKISPEFEDISRIQKALLMWENTRLVKFINATNESSYIVFTPYLYTQSNIGCTGTVQKIEISDSARAGNIAHEIGHALGLFHEHSRSDRNNFVRIKCDDNINYKFALDIDNNARDFVHYDLYSIMHYPPTEDCMEVLVKGLPKGIPGQRQKISEGDKKTIETLYNLKKSTPQDPIH